jgi:hypothetical protein
MNIMDMSSKYNLDINYIETEEEKYALIKTLIASVLLLVGLGIFVFFIIFLVIGIREGFTTMIVVSVISEIIGIALSIIGFIML